MPLLLSLLDRVRISLWYTEHNWGSNQSVGLYLSSCPPITALSPGMVRVEGIWYPWGGGGGTTPDLPPVDQTPHLTLT